MTSPVHTAALIAVMAIGSMLLRFLPFLVFRKKTPPFIAYLGKVLPSAIIGMLIVYCLRETNVTAMPFGLPELIATGIVVLLQIWKRKTILSIIAGTAAYMLLLQVVF
ncbi:MAG: AzlD domain-containing protein [Oscillospiraceae bacterium]|nr:AzlD domain-containing protein [Oscillospiraceae bacterium]